MLAHHRHTYMRAQTRLSIVVARPDRTENSELLLHRKQNNFNNVNVCGWTIVDTISNICTQIRCADGRRNGLFFWRLHHM